ncbi:PQQ-like beta-propeller repeat protein [Ruania alkalisoli]|uniref:PQQ-like beta-propeller repeat protein n=1 Tax=Ruania alkalisoli TaxID=2779775 RepID=A0A7M1SQK5_9MICO|nr:PQQ-like beta-propeller repeat protein [Ruania alkalisoli]QOR69721.1 PQQ-like beta-propeller repeat protein [Ruania alkalisoli]
MRIRPSTTIALAASAAMLIGAAAPATANSGPPPAVSTEVAASDPVTHLGEAVRKTQVLASATDMGPDGVPYGYYVVSGNQNVTAEFAVVDLRTEETVMRTRLPYGASSQRALDVSPVDGTVYFGTSDVGHVYRYVPGADDVEHLAELPTGVRAWGLAVDEDGVPWIGGYPTGALYSVDPDSGVLTNHGQAIAGEQYINSIAPVGDTIYVGTNANAKLAEFDRTTGTFTEIAMPAGHSGNNITALDVRGDLMFVSTTSMYVRNLVTGEWVDEITDANARVSPVSPTDPDAVYLRQGREVKRYDLATGEITGTGKFPNATPESWGWMDVDGTGPYLTLTYWRDGRTYGWNLATGAGFYLVPDVEGAGAPLISLGAGPLGNIYAGAFLSPPGSGKYDPDGEGIALLNGTSQVEGWGTFDGNVIFGRYPQGSVYLYDPELPWNYGSNPDTPPLELGNGVSRPQSLIELTAVPDTVAVASVPKPGEHGGAITLWQPYAGTHTVYRDVVPDQTPVGFVQHEGILIGGTSIEGGYGIDPVTDEAVVFAWDPVSTETMWTATPIPGAETLAGFAIDADGHLWGVADSRTVFEFDLQTQSLLRTVTIDSDAPIDRFGDNDRLLFDHGRLFGSVADRLFVLDQVTGEVTSLYGAESGRSDGVTQVHELAQDRYGDLYVISQGTRLARYDLPEDVTAPEVTVDARGAAVWLTATDDQDDAPRIDYRVDNGDWQSYDGEDPIVVVPGAELEYRAIDDAWNSSEVGYHSFW